MTYLKLIGDLRHTSGTQTKVNRIVIHGTASPCKHGGARDNAAWFANPAAGGLAHYVVDPGEIVQTCPENLIAWQSPPNGGSIGVELCDPVDGPKSRWGDELHQQMLRRAAPLVADLCHRWDVPTLYIDRVGLFTGRRGITTHNEVSKAWRKSNHYDPGPDFPMEQFIEMVQQAEVPKSNLVSMVTPVTPTSESSDMPLSDEDVEKVAQRTTALLFPLIRNDFRTLLGNDPNEPDSDPTHSSLGDIVRDLRAKPSGPAPL